jgi:hypothetical protein
MIHLLCVHSQIFLHCCFAGWTFEEVGVARMTELTVLCEMAFFQNHVFLCKTPRAPILETPSEVGYCIAASISGSVNLMSDSPILEGVGNYPPGILCHIEIHSG